MTYILWYIPFKQMRYLYITKHHILDDTERTYKHRERKEDDTRVVI
jgi:hypothetical protein